MATPSIYKANPTSSKTVNQSTITRVGTVLDKKHTSDPSLYYVAFNDKTIDSNNKLSGIWCTNGLASFTRYQNEKKQKVSYGSFMPIQPGTPVRVDIAKGGLGSATIVGFAPTNTSLPDVDNPDQLYVVAQTPKGSSIEMDDKRGSIDISYGQGNTQISLSDDLIALEALKGGHSKKEADTGIFLRKGAIIFKLPDSQLQFDETGLSLSFDEGGTSMRITKKDVTFESMEVFKVASKEQVSLKGAKLNLQGTKDASLTASELKIGGKQLTNITGNQITIESFFNTTLKSFNLTHFIYNKIQTFATFRDATIAATDVRTSTIIAEQSATHNVVTGAYAMASGIVALDTNVLTNMGIGIAVAIPSYTAAKASMLGIHAALTAIGTSLVLKVLPVTIANKILADLLAGSSEPAQEPSGNVCGIRDKNDKKSYAAVNANLKSAREQAAKNLSILPNTIATNADAVSAAFRIGVDHALAEIQTEPGAAAPKGVPGTQALPQTQRTQKLQKIKNIQNGRKSNSNLLRRK